MLVNCNIDTNVPNLQLVKLVIFPLCPGHIFICFHLEILFFLFVFSIYQRLFPFCKIFSPLLCFFQFRSSFLSVCLSVLLYSVLSLFCFNEGKTAFNKAISASFFQGLFFFHLMKTFLSFFYYKIYFFLLFSICSFFYFRLFLEDPFCFPSFCSYLRFISFLTDG